MGSGGTAWENDDLISDARMNQKTIFIGASEPATMYAGMIWFDISGAVGVFKQRNKDNNAWDIQINQNLLTTSSPTFVNQTLTGYIDIAVISPPSQPVGGLRLYVEDIHGFSFFSFIDSTSMVRKIVRDSVFLVKNVTGSTISKNKAVYASGSSGNVPTVALAKADAMATMPCIGITIEEILDGHFGRVIQVGLIENINTDAYTEGNVLYVSDSSAGDFTTTLPITPSLTQEIGTVLVKGVDNGAVQVISKSVSGNEYGTIQNTFYIGSGLIGSKTLTFNAVADGSIVWNGTTFSLSAGLTLNGNLLFGQNKLKSQFIDIWNDATFINNIFIQSQRDNSITDVSLIPAPVPFSGLKTILEIYATDFVADSTNYEVMRFGTEGINFDIAVTKGGTGSLRPLRILMGADTIITIETDSEINFNSRKLHTLGTLEWGGDTNLYRSAANVLMTDDWIELAIGRGIGVSYATVDGWYRPTYGMVIAYSETLGSVQFMAHPWGYPPAFTWRSGLDNSIWMALTGAGQLQLPLVGSSGGLVLGGDAILYRSAANVLHTVNNFDVYGNISLGGSYNCYLSGASPALNFGNGVDAWDVNLYRSAANVLKTDDSFQCGDLTISKANASLYIDATSGNPVLQIKKGSYYWNQYIQDLIANALSWNYGGGSVLMCLTTAGQLTLPTQGTSGGLLIGGDTQLYRAGANYLQTPDNFIIGDTNYNLYIQSDTPKINFGDRSGAWDVNLYRSAANILKTDDSFQAAGYKSSDGTDGVTGDVVVLDSATWNGYSVDVTYKTLHFKNGLYVGYT